MFLVGQKLGLKLWDLNSSHHSHRSPFDGPAEFFFNLVHRFAYLSCFLLFPPKEEERFVADRFTSPCRTHTCT